MNIIITHLRLQASFSAETAENIQYLEDTSGVIRLAYFTNDGTEYVMPFFVTRFKESYAGFTEGDIYTAANFMNGLKEIQQQYLDENGQPLFGGTVQLSSSTVPSYAKTSSSVPLWIYPMLSAALLTGVGMVLVFQKKRISTPSQV